MRIVLICIICIILFLLSILVVPLKYKADAHISKEEDEDTWHAEYNGAIKLLMGFILIKFIYDKKSPELQVRLCGLPVVNKIITKERKESKNTKELKKEKSNRKHEFRGFDFIKKCWTFLKDIIEVIKPRTFAIEGVYGFDDPSVTGAVCAVSAVVKPLIPFCRINLTPVFEEESCDVKVHIDGGFPMMEAIYKTLRFIFRKDIRKVIFKKHKKAETN